MLIAILLAGPAACSDRGDPGRGDGPVSTAEPSAEGGAALLSRDALLHVNGTELFVRRMGAGEPVLVVHGGPVLEHGYFLPHLEPLATARELIFYDQRLSGRSAGTVDTASVRLQTFVDDIEALRAALALDRIHVLAHSWGGLLALRYAIEHPGSVASLVLVSPMPHSAALWQSEQANVSALTTTQDSLVMNEARASVAFEQRTPEGIERVLLASYRPQFYDRTKLEGLSLFVPPDYSDRSRQFGYLAPDLMDFDLTRQLSRVTAPTLILYGDIEPASELTGAALHGAIDDSRLVVISKAGHFAFVEQPEIFSTEVAEFLSRHPIGVRP